MTDAKPYSAEADLTAALALLRSMRFDLTFHIGNTHEWAESWTLRIDALLQQHEHGEGAALGFSPPDRTAGATRKDALPAPSSPTCPTCGNKDRDNRFAFHWDGPEQIRGPDCDDAWHDEEDAS